MQPRVISVSQSTEMGTVYTQRELKTLSSFAHKNNMLLHMDGAQNRERRNKSQFEFEGDHCGRGYRCPFVWRREERDDVRRGSRLF